MKTCWNSTRWSSISTRVARHMLSYLSPIQNILSKGIFHIHLSLVAHIKMARFASSFPFSTILDFHQERTSFSLRVLHRCRPRVAHVPVSVWPPNQAKSYQVLQLGVEQQLRDATSPCFLWFFWLLRFGALKSCRKLDEIRTYYG